MGVASEAGELLQIFRFLTEAESAQLESKTLEQVQDEIGDVFIFLAYLADTLGMDAIELAERKFAIQVIGVFLIIKIKKGCAYIGIIVASAS